MEKRTKKGEVVIREEIKGTPALLISQAIAQGRDLSQLKDLLAIQKDYEANEARKAYHKAMAEFKANLPQITKDKKVNYSAGGGQVRYSHASLFNVMNTLNPALSKYSLSVAWIQKQTQTEISVTCRVTHALGYSEETTLSAQADKSGSKNDIQAIGSTVAYLQRYTVLALIGTATKDMDDDGKAAGPALNQEKITEAQLSEMLDIIDNSDPKISKKKFLEFLKIAKLEDLPKTDYAKALASLKNIVAGKNP